jgi:hypothetical protein
LRQGHLSERALTDALLTGERPGHLDRCDICAKRAVELSRWLDEVRLVGLEAADAIFSNDQLQAQHAHIMRRLEQIEQPVARVIAFPAAIPVPAPVLGRRVAAGWLGVAAAAGLALGLLGGQLTARLDEPGTPAATAQLRDANPRPDMVGYTVDDLLRSDLEQLSIPSLEAMNESTPRMMANAGG